MFALRDADKRWSCISRAWCADARIELQTCFMRFLSRLISCSALIALSACATLPPRAPYTPADVAAALSRPGDPMRFWASGDDEAYRLWGETVLEQRRAKALPAPAT